MSTVNKFMSEKIVHKLAKNLTRYNFDSALKLVGTLPEELAKKFVTEAYEYAPAEVLVSGKFINLEKKLA